MPDIDLTAPAAAPPHRPAGRMATRLPGLGLSGLIATAGLLASHLGVFQRTGMSALTLAIVFGMVVGNTFYGHIAGRAAHGVTFSKQDLLRLGVVLYGLRLTFQDIARVGVDGVLVDVVMLGSTFALAWLAGTRLFGLDRRTAMLIGAGSSICGAAAVMATEPVVRGRAEQVAVAVATVVVFGTVSIFLYPALYAFNQQLHIVPGGMTGFGIYTGATVHEVAQVVAAARSISIDTANTAVIVKMVRVMLLAPFLLALSVYLGRERGAAGGDRVRITIPWFALGFVAVAALNSLHILPAPVVGAVDQADTFILAMAMAALGLTTHVSAVRRAGVGPLLLAALLYGWLVIGGAGVSHLILGH